MNRKNLTSASLLLNIFLAGIVGLLLRTPAVSRQETKNDVPVAPQESRKPEPQWQDAAPLNYTTVRTCSDLRQWVAQLRAEGVPNTVLAGLIQMDFNERWQKRQDETQEEYNRGDIGVDALTRLNLDHDVEQEKELRAVLGEEGFKQWDKTRLLRDLGFKEITLTPAEEDAVYQLKKGLEVQLRELEEQKLDGAIDQATLSDREQKAQTDFDRQLKTLLGDSRFSTVKGVSSDLGDLRRGLQNVNLTDAQFARMVEVQDAWRQQHDKLQPRLSVDNDPAIGNDLQALNNARDQAYQQILGTDAFSQFQRQQDSVYLDLNRYANLWGINGSDIDSIYGTLKEYQYDVQHYREQERALEAQGQAVDWTSVNQNIQQFSQATEDGLRNYLGIDRFTRIQNNQLFPFNSP